MIVGVVGAGAMGRGIAQVAATAGHEVLLFDADPTAVSAALTAIEDSLGRAVQRGLLTEDERTETVARLAGVGTIEGLSPCALVIEAVVERIDVKRSVFTELEAIVSAETLLASNTSSLSIASIAAPLARRERVLGLHFFNPVPAMQLVEIVKTPFSTAETLTTAEEFVLSIGKVGVRVQDSPGFLVNLAGRAYVTEALAIIQERIATPAQVDRIAREVLDFPLGPFELMDLTGIDINYAVTANLFEHNFADPRLRSTWYHRYLLDAGFLGRKTGRGFHEYPAPPVETTPAQSAAGEDAPLSVAIAADARADALTDLCRAAGIRIVDAETADLILIAPLGADCAQTAAEAHLDPLRTVGVDMLLSAPAVHTVMVGPGVPDAPVSALVRRLRTLAPVEVITDSPGFIAQRLLAAVVNLASDIAQRGIAEPEDIDTAVTLGLRYPHGPLEWGDMIGLDTISLILTGMYTTTTDQRYVPSPWLRRRAAAGLSALTPDHTTH